MSERRERLRSLQKALARRSFEAFHVGARPNVRYLTGFTGSAGELLVTAHEATLFTDGRYETQAVEQTDGVEVAISTDRPGFAEMSDQLAERRIRALGFEAGRLCFAHYQALRAVRPRLRLEPVSGWIEKRRAVKSPSEIEILRRSAALNSRAFENVLKRWRPRWTERRVAAEIDYEIGRLGGEGPSFDTIVAGGEHGALPHAAPRPLAPARKSLIVLDHGAILDGYASDMTRMASWGRPGAAAQRIFKAVLEAQQAALDAVRAGVAAKSVDRAARTVLERRGFGDCFPHSTGHGVGLEIHESPKLGKNVNARLREGMVVTIEPGAYVEGVGGVRIEDMVVVTASGCEILTPTPKTLRIL